MPLVVTVADDPDENRWYASVAETAARLRPAGDHTRPMPHCAAARARSSRALQPDFLFSFYYRSHARRRRCSRTRAPRRAQHARLAAAEVPRARARSTGRSSRASARPARRCTTWSSAPMPATSSISWPCPSSRTTTRARSSPRSRSPRRRSWRARSRGSSPAPRRAARSRLLPGQYFGRRTPEDGRIDWRRPALEIHNLVRAVAPPFPRGVCRGGRRALGRSTAPASATERRRSRARGCSAPTAAATLACGDGGVLRAAARCRMPSGAIDLAAARRASRAARAAAAVPEPPWR